MWKVWGLRGFEIFDLGFVERSRYYVEGFLMDIN